MKPFAILRLGVEIFEDSPDDEETWSSFVDELARKLKGVLFDGAEFVMLSDSTS